MSFPLSLASITENPSLTELIEFQATGLVVVFSALITIWIFLELLGKVFRNRAPAPAAAQPTAPRPAAADAATGTPPQAIAAISAAVHVALQGRAHRIASIKLAGGQPNWAAEGRREHFSSHRVR